MNDKTNLPASGNKVRLLQGVVLKCVDGRWFDKDGIDFPNGTQMLVLGLTEAVQCWKDAELLDEIIQAANEPLPDVADLNAQIPRDQWDEGLDGQPRPPWSHQYAVYLLDLGDASVRTFVNSTTGARIAFERLKDRIKWMRQLRGSCKIVPIVELQSCAMKTKVGQKMRPHFTIVDWKELGGGRDGSGAPALPGGGDGGGGPGVALEAPKQSSTAEPTKEQAKPADKRTKGLKPVKPVSTSEELNDEIPWLG